MLTAIVDRFVNFPFVSVVMFFTLQTINETLISQKMRVLFPSKYDTRTLYSRSSVTVLPSFERHRVVAETHNTYRGHRAIAR